MSKPTPFELWRQSGEDREKYRALLREHGMLVPRCQYRGTTTDRRCTLEADHMGHHDLENRDIFGHPKR